MTLEVDKLDAGYGAVRVLRGLTLAVAPGEVLCLMGRNGAGKSTALKAIMGLVPATAGAIRLDATRLDTLPAHDVPRRGVAWVPQGRRLFAELTVAENLDIGLMTRRHGPATRDRALALFPRLRERLAPISGDEGARGERSHRQRERGVGGDRRFERRPCRARPRDHQLRSGGVVRGRLRRGRAEGQAHRVGERSHCREPPGQVARIDGGGCR